MLIYISTFSISLALINTFYIKSINSNLKKILITIGILLPCILAGLRDYCIGTDILTYGNTWFNYAAKSHNLLNFLKFANWSNIGIGYALLNFIVSKIINNPHFFYFTINLICNFLFFISLKRNRDICNITLGMAIYYFVYWGIFLNALRQSLALSIVFFSFYYIRKNELSKFLICVLIAYFFHSSAVIGILLYFIHWLNYKVDKRYRVCILVLIAVCIIFFWNFLGVIDRFGLLPNRYAEYLQDTSHGGGAWIRIFYYGILLFVYFFSCRFLDKKVEKKDFFWYLLLSLCFSTLAFRDAQSIRIAHYFDVMSCYSLSYLAINSRVKKKYVIYFILFIICILLLYFIFVFGIRGSDQIVPYLFFRS